MNFTRKALAGSVLAGAMFFAGGMAPATAAQQDGLVNVNVENNEILNDVNIGVAAQIVAQLCDVRVGPIAGLAAQVDSSGVASPAQCTVDG